MNTKVANKFLKKKLCKELILKTKFNLSEKTFSLRKESMLRSLQRHVKCQQLPSMKKHSKLSMKTNWKLLSMDSFLKLKVFSDRLNFVFKINSLQSFFFKNLLATFVFLLQCC